MNPSSLPPARVVRQAGAATHVSLRVRLARVRPLAARAVAPLRTLVLYALAFWPLTAIMLFGAAMILAAGNAANP